MFYDISCVILAGGKSSRMGQDKALLPFNNFSTLAQYQYDKYSSLFSKVYISSKSDKFDFEVDIIKDNTQDISSPMVALYSILDSISTQKVFIITVDTPLVQQHTIKTLINSSKKFDITIAQDPNKIHNLCGVFDKQILPTIKDMITNNNHKINHLINSVKSSIIMFEDTNQFLNINTKDDYTKAILVNS